MLNLESADIFDLMEFVSSGDKPSFLAEAPIEVKEDKKKENGEKKEEQEGDGGSEVEVRDQRSVNESRKKSLFYVQIEHFS